MLMKNISFRLGDGYLVEKMAQRWKKNVRIFTKNNHAADEKEGSL